MASGFHPWKKCIIGCLSPLCHGLGVLHSAWISWSPPPPSPAGCAGWWSCSWVCCCWGWSGPSGRSTSPQQGRTGTAPYCDIPLTDRPPLQSNQCLPAVKLIIRSPRQGGIFFTICATKIRNFPRVFPKFQTVLIFFTKLFLFTLDYLFKSKIRKALRCRAHQPTKFWF